MHTVSLPFTPYIHSLEFPDILRGRGAMLTAVMGGILAGAGVGSVLLSLSAAEVTERVHQAEAKVQEVYADCSLASLKIGFAGAGSDVAMFLPSDCRAKP